MRPFWPSLRTLAIFVVLGLGREPVYATSHYLVPVFGSRIEGASGRYESDVLITNPHEKPVVVRVDEIYPTSVEACDRCSGQRSVVLQPRATLSLLADGIFKDRQKLVLGAFGYDGRHDPDPVLGFLSGGRRCA